MIDYNDFPGLAGVYLEDSFVLAIRETADQIVFELEAVLTPENPQYRPPAAGEQHCYARTHLVFPIVREIEWISRSVHHYTDAAGEHDLGNIDVLSVDGNVHVVEGDWGQVRIVGSPPYVALTTWRPVTGEESDVIRTVVAASGISDDPSLLQDLRGAAARNAAAWIVELENPEHASGHAELPDGRLPVRAYVSTNGTNQGEIIVWMTNGRVSGLEYAWVTDRPPARWPRPDEIDVAPTGREHGQ